MDLKCPHQRRLLQTHSARLKEGRRGTRWTERRKDIKGGGAKVSKGWIKLGSKICCETIVSNLRNQFIIYPNISACFSTPHLFGTSISDCFQKQSVFTATCMWNIKKVIRVCVQLFAKLCTSHEVHQTQRSFSDRTVILKERGS